MDTRGHYANIIFEQIWTYSTDLVMQPAQEMKYAVSLNNVTINLTFKKHASFNVLLIIS